jgi:excisionase family DNA binding protein
MSIERHLHGTATAVSELWTDENDTRARLAALHERASRETSDQEQPQAPSTAPREPSAAERANFASRRRSERPLNEVAFLTVAEVASVMSVSKMTVYRLVNSGHLPAIRVGRSFRVPEEAVYEYLRESWQGAEVDGR